jgi:hypothetical protein
LDGFLATERERKLKVYVSVAELNDKEVEKIINEKFQKYSTPIQP